MFCLYLKLRRLWIVVSIVSISSLTSWSYAQEKSPIETLKLRDAMLQELDISKGNLIQEETMRRSIISGFDFKRHSRISLGKYWRNRTEEEQGEFVSVMRKWTEQKALDKLRKSSDKTDYDSQDVRGNQALVKTILWYKGIKTLVDYKMGLIKGKWLIYDMVIDGASIALANRDAFYQKINKSSYEELLSTLRLKILENDQ